MTAPTFPDNRWGSDDSRLRRAAIALSCTTPGSWLVRVATPLDRRVMNATKGKYTLLGPIGAPTLLLTTTGRKSGQPRQSPLLYARDGESLIVAGSNFGQDHHPAWTGNLMATPTATVTMAGRDIDVRATHLSGADAEAAYQRLVAVARTYAEYRNRTERSIRVFRLDAL